MQKVCKVYGSWRRQPEMVVCRPCVRWRSGLNAAAVCAGVVSVMSTLGCRAIWAMAERVGLRQHRFSFRGAAAVAIDLASCYVLLSA